MKFAHMGDVHIGSFREPELNNLSLLSFSNAIQKCIVEKVDFILISGDLFNTALPDINQLKIVAELFKKVKDEGISCYIIPGSHDFSPSGKTMLDVLESAGLLINVVKAKQLQNGKISLVFSVDEKTGAKITGMLGKKGGLEKEYYKNIDYSNIESEKTDSEKGYKIFMFHSTITELKPKDMAFVESNPISILPKNFNYYAGGHIHIIKDVKYGTGEVVYPGPIYPCNFKELEELECGGFFIVNVNDGITTKEYHKIKIFDTIKCNIDADNKTPKDIERELTSFFDEKNIQRKIILIRIEGELKEGKTADIGFSNIFDLLMSKGAYYILKNTSKLSSKEFREVKVESDEDVEEEIIKNNIGQMALDNYDIKNLVLELMNNLDDERLEGETVSKYEERIIEKMEKIFKI